MQNEIVPNGNGASSSHATCAVTKESGATTTLDRARTSSAPVAPRYRTTSGEHTLHLVVAVPGVPRDSVTLHVEEGVLQLDAKQADHPTPIDPLKQALEFRLADYRGRWRLPENVDVERITSTLRHGELEITLPLHRPAGRTIQVG